MIENAFKLAFIGPGGPEFVLVVLALIMMFGAKDAPRILRKLNEMFNQIRNTADGFKREVMYGDLHSDTPASSPVEYQEPYDCDADAGCNDFSAMEDGLNESETEEEAEGTEDKGGGDVEKN